MHELFLRRAIELAHKNVKSGKGGPFGAIVVCNNEIVAEGVNLVTSSNDPTAHAEIVALRAACTNKGSFQLPGCALYCSCEPCPMCLGAFYWARPEALYFAATRVDAAQAGFDDAFIYEELTKAPETRTFKTEHVALSGADLPFLAWQENASKVEY